MIDTDDGATLHAHGLVWGPVGVELTAILPHCRRVLTVSTEYDTIEIFVSRTGRSVRVYRKGGGELTDG